MLIFLPVILHLVIGGRDNFPLFPIPILPRCLILFWLPLLIGWAVPLPFFLPSIILCSVCFLHLGQYLFLVFGSFISRVVYGLFKKLAVYSSTALP